MLFHKAGLAEAGADLAANLKKEIASPKRKIVGVVVNAVDDHLAKGEQVAVPWSLKHIPILGQLLYAAHDAGRVVILTSDHGHVIERQTTYKKSEPGERFRADDGNLIAEELRVTGSRVLLPANHRLIAPWSETLRYGVKKHGYHGGISPQECAVPLAILSRATPAFDGWTELPLYRPEWWYLWRPKPVEQQQKAIKVTATAKTLTRQLHRDKPAETLPLFPLREELAASAEIESSTGKSNWIERLLASPVFISQSKLAGRATPPAEVTRNFLQALDERGGSILKSALAQRLGQPKLRMPGILAAMRRLLNVEGYAVLAVDELAETISLNYELLKVQFELEQ